MFSRDNNHKTEFLKYMFSFTHSFILLEGFPNPGKDTSYRNHIGTSYWVPVPGINISCGCLIDWSPQPSHDLLLFCAWVSHQGVFSLLSFFFFSFFFSSLLTWVFLIYISIVIPFPGFRANVPQPLPLPFYIGVPLPILPPLLPSRQKSRSLGVQS